MKRNWHAIRAALRDGTFCDPSHQFMIDEMPEADRDAIAMLDDAKWSAMCRIAREAGFWHFDISAPALPASLIISISEAA